MDRQEQQDKTQNRWLFWGFVGFIALSYAIPRMQHGEWQPNSTSEAIFYIEPQWFAKDKITRCEWREQGDQFGWFAQDDKIPGQDAIGVRKSYPLADQSLNK